MSVFYNSNKRNGKRFKIGEQGNEGKVAKLRKTRLYVNSSASSRLERREEMMIPRWRSTLFEATYLGFRIFSPFRADFINLTAFGRQNTDLEAERPEAWIKGKHRER